MRRHKGDRDWRSVYPMYEDQRVTEPFRITEACIQCRICEEVCPEQVIKGATLLAKCFGVDKVYIGIEANKQNAADVLNKTIAELNAPVVVEVLHTRYPQGAEKQLVQAVSGRQVPSGKLPADAGCCIFNLNTTCAIYRAVYTGMPVVNKIVTVSGSGVIDPKNAGLIMGVSGATNASSSTVRAISQSIAAGTEVEAGTVVRVQFSDSSVRD